MLRLPTFELVEPTTAEAAVALLAEHGDEAVLLAGGTDLVPNMKHELVTPKLVISLARIPELTGIRIDLDGQLVIGAMTRLDEMARNDSVLRLAPALAQAASLVAGPQLRRMGTLGGNVMLDTRCQWINQSYFWRSALGFCLKKDGSVCHVVAGGKNCVAAASNDTAPALLTLDAELLFLGPHGRRTLALDALYDSDGVYNKTVKGELLLEVRVPRAPFGHLGAYGKLRERGSIDFPLFGVAARLDVNAAYTVSRAELAVVALQGRPLRLRKATPPLLGQRLGTPAFSAAVAEAAELARKQCHPLDNIPGDAAYRREMVPVYVRRTLLAAAEGSGPVHHV